MDKNHSIGYKIAASVTVGSINVGSVLILSRFGVSLLDSAKGMSTMNETDVVIALDHINDDVNGVVRALQEDKAPSSYTTAAERIFRELRIKLTTAEANRILANLYKMQFSGMTKEEIMVRIAHNIAVHEAKHKWEEKNTNMSRLSIGSYSYFFLPTYA